MSYTTTFNDIVVNIEILEDNITFDIVEDNIEVEIVEDHLDVDIIDDSFNIDIQEDVISVDIVEDHIDVTLDDGCICPPPSGGGSSAVEVYNCDGSLLVGDIVYISSTIEKYVILVPDNNTVNPAVGIVSKILPDNKVEVSHLGFFIVNETLVPGKKVYIGSDGKFTSDIPDMFYVQVMGVAVGSDAIYLNPELRRSKRLEL